MRKETKEKLDKLDRLQHRDNRNVVVAIVSLTLFVGLYSALRNVVLSDQLKNGAVHWSVWKIHEKTGIRYPDIQVLLDDGQLVRTGTLEPEIPVVGARIVVREKIMITGYHKFSWEGTYDQKER